eukprot:COSAG05_NODE_10526_length_561_cov_0.705628_1_plen_49_part_01
MLPPLDTELTSFAAPLSAFTAPTADPRHANQPDIGEVQRATKTANSPAS